jgi:hypothetical protein
MVKHMLDGTSPISIGKSSIKTNLYHSFWYVYWRVNPINIRRSHEIPLKHHETP